MAVVVGFHCDAISCELARPRPAEAVESRASGRGNAVGLTSIFDRRQFLLVPNLAVSGRGRRPAGGGRVACRPGMVADGAGVL